MTTLTVVPFKAKPHTGMSETAVRLMLRAHYIMASYYAMTMYEVDADCEDVPTLSTNGTSVWINPKFWKQLGREHKLTAVAHEIGHRLCMHSARRGERDPYIWNIAGDHVINLMLKEMGFAPLEGLKIDGKPWSWFCDDQYAGWTTEAVYDALLKEYDDKGQDEGEEDGEGDGEGEGSQGGTPGPQRPRKRGNKQAKKDLGDAADLEDYGNTPAGEKDAEAAPGDKEKFEQRVRKEMKDMEAAAKMAGTVPNWLKRTLDAADHMKVLWWDVLQEYIKSLHRADYSWRRWQKREFVKTGILAPDMYEPALGRVLMYVDCSGSCWGPLPVFNHHIGDIWEQLQPKAVDVRYFQTHVNHEYDQTFVRGEGEIEIHQLGGGGTDFRWLDREIAEEPEQYDLVLVLTDMYGQGFGPEPDGVPVVWLSVSSVDSAPWGEVLQIQ